MKKYLSLFYCSRKKYLKINLEHLELKIFADKSVNVKAKIEKAF